MTEGTVAERLVEALHLRGTRRIYGVPGGGSSLDLIAAAEALGMTFVLARTENAAVMMAATDADMTGTPGAALTTKGPGLAQAMNGLAHAALDRSPVVLVTDGFSETLASYVTHQVFDQAAMSAPVVKGHSRLDGDAPGDEIERLLDLALAPTQGPVHVELTGVAARRPAAPGLAASGSGSPGLPELAEAHDLLSKARRPVVVLGLETRATGVSDAVRRFVDALGCPALTTYKAKGVVPEDHPARVGLFTGGAAEAPTVEQADLVVLVGLDPVELILQPWRYDIPVLDIATVPHRPHYVEAEAGVYGPLGPALDALAARNRAGAWEAGEIAALRDAMHAGLCFPARGSLDPKRIVEHAAGVFGETSRATVDAGAHMLSAMAFWPAQRPCDVQISNGLASMAYALPAGIAAALAEPERPVLAFTGRRRADDVRRRAGDGGAVWRRRDRDRLQRRRAQPDRSQAAATGDEDRRGALAVLGFRGGGPGLRRGGLAGGRRPRTTRPPSVAARATKGPGTDRRGGRSLGLCRPAQGIEGLARCSRDHPSRSAERRARAPCMKSVVSLPASTKCMPSSM
nr:thiamine pyrophosphate-binding protein [Salipiger mucosus]